MPMFYVYCLYSVNTDVVWGDCIERETRDIHNNNCKSALYLCRMCVSVNGYASFCRSYEICTLTEFHFVWNIFKVNAKRISFTIIRNPPYSLHFSLRFSVPVECYRRQYFPYEAFTQLIYAYTAATTTTTIPTTTATAAVHEDREQGEMERVRLTHTQNILPFQHLSSTMAFWNSDFHVFTSSQQHHLHTTTDNNQ